MTQRFCKDCKYFVKSVYLPSLYCRSPELPADPVTGQRIERAIDARLDEKACGSNATWFVMKQEEPKHKSLMDNMREFFAH